MTAPDPMPLPELPEPARRSGQQMCYDGYDKAFFDCFDPSQMRAYGEACARAALAALEAEKAEVFRLRDALAQAKGVPEGCSYPSCVGEQPADGGCCRTPFTSQMSEAAERYLKSVGPNGYWLPAPFRWDDCYRAMLAATPPSPAQAAGWRDIESAPRDGRPFIGGEVGHDWVDVCSIDEQQDADQAMPIAAKLLLQATGRASYRPPTHWMPLPAAPGQQTGGQSTNQPG